MKEGVEYVAVRNLAQCQRIELVGIHELVEDIGTEHHSLRYQGPDRAVWILRAVFTRPDTIEVFVTCKQSVEEGETTSLASERTISDTREVAVLVESLSLEDCNHTLILHTAVCHDGIEDDLTVGIDVLKESQVMRLRNSLNGNKAREPSQRDTLLRER